LSLSLYIHIPWCIKKCPYCDFNSHAIKSDTPEARYIDALLLDLAADLQRYGVKNRPIHSIFIGGGTPSLFAPESFTRLLDGIARQISLQENLEITLEANPGTFESHKFAEYRALGINRLSIGVQTFNDGLLKKLGRVHSAQEAIIAAEIAHQAGFDNFNIDLMFGLPDDAFDSLNDVRQAISLKPTHISFYQLTLEPNTYFHKFPPQLPDDEVIFAMQQRCQQQLAIHGYQQYEISAYSQQNRQCRHNLNYWQFGDYLGIGAGAHGKISQQLPQSIIRSFKTKSPEQYMQSPHDNGGSEVVARNELPLEFIMNNLRLKQGFTPESYQANTGLTVDSLEPVLSDCLQQGLIIQQDHHYRCSATGWNFLDSILEKFISVC
jgi:putative oxygen-independent coproporphyrinogen III oxidase